MKVFYEKAKVISLKRIGDSYLEIVLENRNIARWGRPANFVLIKGWENYDPLLARPFDIVQADGETGRFMLVIKVTGRGTRLLAKLEDKSEVSVIGPLGKAIEDFSISRIGLLVRGVGAAAVVLLAEKARERGIEVYTFLSASTGSRLVCRELLEKYSTEIEIATDDGTIGYHGDARERVSAYLDEPGFDRLYTCGSRRFARFVKDMDKQGRIEGYLFLETYMACGMGDCHGCAVGKATGEGYYLVCKDGPVFRSSDVVID